jgi:hypothetical protein
VRSENSAENFLGARAHHTVSSAQLAAYQASVNERDRFRFAAGLGFASAAGLFVTGLFLHELDRPSVPERKASSQPQSASNALRSVAVLPVSPTGVPGATLLVQF